jgi:hypothetical protein
VLGGVALGTQAAASALVLHAQEGFGGRSTTLIARTPDLTRWDFGDRAMSAIVSSGNWQLCVKPDFAPPCVVLVPGRYPLLAQLGLHGTVGSVRPMPMNQPLELRPPAAAATTPAAEIQAAAQVELHEFARMAGRGVLVRGPHAQLAQLQFDDKASSVTVRAGRWELCTEPGFMGRCVVAEVGVYPDLASWGMDDQISSLRPSLAPATLGLVSMGQPAVSPVAAEVEQARPEITWRADGRSRVTFDRFVDRQPGSRLAHEPLPTDISAAGGSPRCVVWFEPDGLRSGNLPACTPSQVAQAESLLTAFRRQFGMDARSIGKAWPVGR